MLKRCKKMSPKITYDIGKLHLNYIVAFKQKS